jgi:hypothetical protein
VIDGIAGSGGFTFPFDIQVLRGRIFFSELATDALNARILIEIGATSQPAASAAVSGKDFNEASAATDGSPAPLSLIHTSGYFETNWIDPVGILVNTVKDNVSWTYDTSTGKVTSYSGSDFRTWFSGNGWAEVSHYISSYYNSGHTVATVYTNDAFATSSWFPLPACGTTVTYYYANNAYAYGNGNIGGGVNTWVTGTCGFLLHYQGFAGR